MPEEEGKKVEATGTILEEINSEEEADKAIEIAQQKKVELKIKQHEKELRKIKCKCGKSLKVNPKDFMGRDGTRAKRYTCEKCQLQTKVQVTYNKELGELELKINRLQKAWVEMHPSKLSDDQIKEWVKDEVENLKRGRSKFPRKEEQILLRAIDLAINPK